MVGCLLLRLNGPHASFGSANSSMVLLDPKIERTNGNLVQVSKGQLKHGSGQYWCTTIVFLLALLVFAAHPNGDDFVALSIFHGYLRTLWTFLICVVETNGFHYFYT